MRNKMKTVEPEWYEKAYPGGKMVVVKGFPRQLYPPDSSKHGKTPSQPGDDVLAYKRTVSRAGRWPWQEFDDQFSNKFSHGVSNNTIYNSGIAGIQRQQDLDATGWIGEKTFNTLRSIKIPEGLPHAGEMAMDSQSVNLINKAFDKFKGSEPPPPDKTTSAQYRLQKSITQLGIKEYPPDSNQVKYTDWYNMIGPWCAMFCTWCDLTGVKPATATFIQGQRYAYVPYIVADARAKKYGLSTTDDPIPGDLACYDWEFNGEYDHVGIFEKWTSGVTQFNCIEGNTSTSNNSNGGEVMRRSRNRHAQGTVFVKVKEPA
jgi:hypothetical protein